jgi:hypothetical protein
MRRIRVSSSSSDDDIATVLKDARAAADRAAFLIARLAAAASSTTVTFTPYEAALVVAGARASGAACPVTLEPLASCTDFLVPSCLHVCAFDPRIEALARCPTCRQRVEGRWMRVRT